MEQMLNIKFVNEVEKHPELYNYTMKGYSRKNVTDKAWSEVAAEVKLSINDCKEKWKNLRSVFVRYMKPPSGSGSKNKKPYYLIDAMQFMLPFIKTLGTPVGNLTDCSQPTSEPMSPQQGSPDPAQNEFDITEEDEDSQSVHLAVNSPSLFSPTQLPTASIQSQETDLSQEKTTNDTYDFRSTSKRGKPQKRANIDVDKLFVEYLNMKKQKISATSNEYYHEKKMFLLSLLPEIEPMTNTQMSSFRRRVLQLIDDIMNPTPYLQLSLLQTYQHTPTNSLISSSHTSESMESSMGNSSQSLPSFNQMPVEEQQNNDSQMFNYEVVRDALNNTDH